jgi:hypothetical protein
MRPDLLQTRYIGAALLYIVAVAAPLLFGYMIAERVASLWNLDLKMTSLRSELQSIGLLLASIAVLGLVYQYAARIVVVVDLSARNAFGYYIGLLVIGLVVGILNLTFASRQGKRHGSYARIALNAAVVALTAAGFGQKYYPDVTPIFGGGAGWYARLGVASENEPDILLARQLGRRFEDDTAKIDSPGPNAGLQRVIVIDRDEHLLSVLICSSVTKKVVPLTLPNSAVRWLTIDEVVSPNRASDYVC